MTKKDIKKLEKDLWAAADNLRANSDLKPTEYSIPVLGLIFLKFADNKYRQYQEEIEAEYTKLKKTRRKKKLSDIAIEKCGFYLEEHSRYDYLLDLPEEEDIAKAIKRAMESIEEYKPELVDVLPKDEYFKLIRTDKTIPKQLLRNFADIPEDAGGDMFGKIYEYFLGKFAMSEGQKGGEFFTPTSVVKLMVEIIEPHRGTVFDPACGSGGMFVQSAHFIEEHRKELGKDTDIFVYGQEKTLETVNLAKMNLAVNGLRGEVKQANTYYEDPFDSYGQFDYVLANPPFNVDDVSLKAVEKDKRFNEYGVPRKKTKVKKSEQGKETVPNANYLWINLFATSLKDQGGIKMSDSGRAALVMANSASDARHSEADIRQNLIENNLIYCMLTLPSNMFYTVTLPATLWFFDKAKQDDKILFIDTRNIFTQIDRAHREFSEEQVLNIGMISHLHKGEQHKFVKLIDDYFAKGMQKLNETRTNVQPVSEKILEVLDDSAGKAAVADMLKQWAELNKLQTKYKTYIDKFKKEKSITKKNTAQHKLRQTFDPFFQVLHEDLKQLDKTVRKHEKKKSDQAKSKNKRVTVDRKTKELKSALEELHKEIKKSELFYKHIFWLQERFPKANYEDVTGLCKLATQEEIKDQGFSLNPGRYVGVVIEDDGKTEEEFINETLLLNEELQLLVEKARDLEDVINKNVIALTG
tara:strand:- start:328 stop:2412 length:2085 start_codon:yes stop_codon:yes gene_type:complete